MHLVVHGTCQPHPYCGRLSGRRDRWCARGRDKDLDIALRHSVEETVKFLVANKAMTPLEGYSLASTAIDFSIAEAVDETLIVYGKVSKSWFAKKTPYWSVKK